MCRYFKKKPIWPALSSGSKKMGRSPFHSLRSFHYERPIFPLLLTQLLQKQRYTTDSFELHLMSCEVAEMSANTFTNRSRHQMHFYGEY
jgi:hypothetical protein